MSETTATTATATATATENQAPVFHIQRVYLKDASLEQPNCPEILLNQDQPALDIQLGVQVNPLRPEQGLFEVCVMATVHTKIEEKTLFLVEAKQAGIFEIQNIPEEQLDRVLGISCPQILYPYLRGNIADIINRAGFAPVHMAEINFQNLYEQRQAQQQAESGQASQIQ